jgi:hypothetical protein
VSVLHRLRPELWRAFPGARLRVRLDAGFATPDVFDQLEAAGFEYVVAMAGNAALACHAEPSVAPLRAIVATTQDTATAYAEAAYQAVGRRPGARSSKRQSSGTTGASRGITALSSPVCARRLRGSIPTSIARAATVKIA